MKPSFKPRQPAGCRVRGRAVVRAGLAGIALAAGVVGPAQALQLCANAAGILFALPVCPSGFAPIA